MVITSELKGKKVEILGTAEKEIQLVVKSYIIQTTHIIAVAMVIDVVSALLSQSFTLRIVKLLFLLDQHQRLLLIGVRIIISFLEIQEQSQ